ncbi:hypothetical protein KKA14_11800 [bacterium]|nr:hypothetical protein [bacterium]
MIPRLGKKYDIEIETVAKPQEAFKSDEYLKSRQPIAPAIKVGDELVVEKADISEEKLEIVICRHLGLPEPQPGKKGFLSGVFG